MKTFLRNEVLIGLALIVIAAMNTVHLNKIMFGFGFALLYLPVTRYFVGQVNGIFKNLK